MKKKRKTQKQIDFENVAAINNYDRGYEDGKNRALVEGQKLGYEQAKKELQTQRYEAINKTLEAYAKIVDAASHAITAIASELQR